MRPGLPILVFATILASRPDAVLAQATQTLTLEQAVQLAMQQQPALRQSRAELDAARGRIDQARVPLRPTATAAASAQIGSSFGRRCPPPNDNMACGGFFDPLAQTGLSLQLNWRIYDFGQTSANVRAAELGADASAAGLDTTTLDVRTDVEVAFLEAVARRQLVDVVAATVKNEELHVDQAQRFVAAQARDPIELAQAKARLANARSLLAQNQSQLAIALANLRAAVGWVEADRAPIPEPAWPIPSRQDPPTLNALVEEARKQRPELVALERQVAAAEASLVAAERSTRPILSANATTQWNPSETEWMPEPSWSAGIQLSWQFFDGGRARSAARVARANLEGARAQRDGVLVALTAQLELARAQIIANHANVIASDEAVVQARAQLRLAEGRYTAGIGSQIELTDAQVAVTTAEGNIVQAQWQLATAWAQLRRSLGKR